MAAGCIGSSLTATICASHNNEWLHSLVSLDTPPNNAKSIWWLCKIPKYISRVMRENPAPNSLEGSSGGRR